MSDSIDRQQAIDALKICDNNEDGINCHKCPLRDKRWDGAWRDNETTCYRKLMRDSAKLLELPSEQTEQKIGYWIPIHPLQADDEGVYLCSNCKTGDWGYKTNR